MDLLPIGASLSPACSPTAHRGTRTDPEGLVAARFACGRRPVGVRPGPSRAPASSSAAALSGDLTTHRISLLILCAPRASKATMLTEEDAPLCRWYDPRRRKA
jgi:hypothetical protein